MLQMGVPSIQILECWLSAFNAGGIERFVDGELKRVALEALEKQSLARSKSKDEKNHPKKERVAKAA